MPDSVFTNINKIIERDSKATTYKYALLRGVIDIIQDNSPYIFITGAKVAIPTGLLIEKWLVYFYPIIAAGIPQINGEATLAFSTWFQKLISAYSSRNGFSEFYNDLKNKGIPPALHSDFKQLTRQLQKTITGMPMKHIGYSLSNRYYSIFSFENAVGTESATRVDIDYLIYNFGSFSIPVEYYEAFKLLGSFITGQDSLLYKWAEFSVKASGQKFSIDQVLKEVLKIPVTDRAVSDSKKIFDHALSREGKLHCVWTEKLISKYDIDHVIPFSVWKNNDLWNLLPSQPAVNNRKKDRIPPSALIEARKEQILFYWRLENEYCHDRFQQEMRLSLLGEYSVNHWESVAINRLKNHCDYLIHERGYEEWRL